MDTNEYVTILGYLIKNPYLVKWIDISKGKAYAITNIDNLEVKISTATSISNAGSYAKVSFGNGTSVEVEPISNEISDYIYSKFIELGKSVSEYSKTILLNSCSKRIDITDNY